MCCTKRNIYVKLQLFENLIIVVLRKKYITKIIHIDNTYCIIFGSLIHIMLKKIINTIHIIFDTLIIYFVVHINNISK